MLFHFAPLICLIAACAAEVTEVAVGGARISPLYHQAFQFALPIPSIKKPLTSYTNPKNGIPIDFFEIEAKSFKRKFYSDLPGSSDLVGYDGMFPGPTLRIEKGRETLVRVINRASEKMNVHLHGSYSMMLLLFL
jgi:FtsP/CotA-like multicopper oxidase with cupredoxin domain